MSGADEGLGVMMGTTTDQLGATTDQDVESVDVLIVGAGISGIGCAYYLRRDHPEKSYAILEARAASGGTWDLFKYPGIRSDSDLQTFGFAFKPWTSERAMAQGPEILSYIREAASENGIDKKIRTHHKVLSAAWSSADNRWLVTVERTDTGQRFQISAGWLFAATGYYRYDAGYTPELPGLDRFKGRLVHPQQWPEDLDYAGKRVVVIGSGATAVTLIPAIAPTAGRVTMLQRSPSYIMSLPSKDAIANLLLKLFGPVRGYDLARRKNIFQQTAVYKLCQRYPVRARAVIRWLTAKQLPEGYPVDEHFRPKYDPWDQRLCAVPDGDLFKAIRDGNADVVTDTIETFTETGIRLNSGRELEADIVVTATGLKLLAFGGMEFTVDGEPVELPQRLAFRGLMLSGMPNFTYLIGYTNASWTLKVELVCEHFCRMLSYMDEHGYDVCVPELPYPNMTIAPLLDFSAGYVQRALDDFPKQGVYEPWRLAMSFHDDRRNLADGPIEDRSLRFSSSAAAATAADAPGTPAAATAADAAALEAAP
jgi:cation diffusion facilitator CzcD-associated flavoprotein CzcO